MVASLLVVLPVFGLIGLGYLARWSRLLRETTGEGLSDFVFVLAVPCLLFRTLAKADDALRMGASHVFATEDPATFEEREGSLDLIINTISVPIKLGAHLRLLDVDGVMVQVGVPPEPMSLHMYPLLGGRKSLAGSPIGGLPETQEMLDVAAEHGFGADIETIEASGITAAHDRVVAGDVRYRFVIDIASMA